MYSTRGVNLSDFFNPIKNNKKNQINLYKFYMSKISHLQTNKISRTW